MRQNTSVRKNQSPWTRWLQFTPPTPAAFHVEELVVGATDADCAIYSDGAVLDDTAVSGMAAAAAAGLGELVLGAKESYWSGCSQIDYAELIIYSGTLTEKQRNDVGYYLSQKYGLTTTYVPEPAALLLLGVGSTVAFARRRRRT